MITVQSKKTTSEKITRRHPEILKRKKQFIEERKEEFRQIFIVDYNHYRRKYKLEHYWRMKGKMPNKRLFSRPRAIKMGLEIHEKFGYHPLSNIIDILWHFRRLYLKMYPHEDPNN